MRFRSSVDRYGAIASTAHWATAALILLQLISGVRAFTTQEAVGKITLLRMHVVVGIFILVLTVFRLAWRQLVDRAPTASGIPCRSNRAAAVVHALIYVVLLAVAVSGIDVFVRSGAGAVLFGGRADSLPDLTLYRPLVAHAVAAWLLVVLVTGHATAALQPSIRQRGSATCPNECWTIATTSCQPLSRTGRQVTCPPRSIPLSVRPR